PSMNLPLRNLHVDPVGILDVETGIIALRRSRSTLCKITRIRLRVETRNPDREVIDQCRTSAIIERDQHARIAQANDALRLVLADHSEPEHLLIKSGGPLQVCDVNADMVDI